jgi:hypothetical protein
MAAATAIAAAGLAISIGTTAASFSQASKQKKAQKRAERDADKAMQAARGKLDVNFAEQLSVKKEAYDLEREAMLVQGAQATEAGVESERGSAATAGRVYAAQQAGQGGIRSAMADEMTNIEQQVVDEDSRLRDLDVALDLEEVAGNQQKAADAQRAAQQAKAQGIQGIANTAQAAAAFVPLYGQNIGAQKAAVGGLEFTPEQMTKFGNVEGNKVLGAAGSDGFTNMDMQAIGNMSNRQFRSFKRDLTPQQSSMLFKNQDYVSAYKNPFDIYIPRPQ